MSIKLSNISVTYNKGLRSEKSVLRDVFLDVTQGEFVAVIGNNGTGKSTLAKVIAGEVIADKGELVIGGKNVTTLRDFERSNLISRVFQDPNKGTAPNLTVMENLAFANSRGKSRTFNLSINESIKSSLIKKLEMLGVGLDKRFDEPVSMLSGGQRQILSLLMAVLQPAKVLLLDEHTAALDPDAAALVMKFTHQFLRDRNITTIMITHDMSELVYCDAVYVIDGGDIKKVDKSPS